MVAPPFAAGYPSVGLNVLRPRSIAKQSAPHILHAIVPVPKHKPPQLDLGHSDNVQLRKQLHGAPTWTMHVLREPVHTSRSPHPAGPRRRDLGVEFRSFCVGLAAVAKHGGANVHMGDAPTTSLLDGVLLSWGLRPSSAVAPGLDGHDGNLTPQAAPVALWAYARPELCRPDGNPGSARSSANCRKQLSWRLFAAPRPQHPVAVRMATACTRLIVLVDREDANSSNPSDEVSLLQLQHAMADDASSINFYAEQSVFVQ